MSTKIFFGLIVLLIGSLFISEKLTAVIFLTIFVYWYYCMATDKPEVGMTRTEKNWIREHARAAQIILAMLVLGLGIALCAKQ